MKRQEYKIIFQPDGLQVFALPGTPILEVAARAGLVLQTPCGGSGKCGKCKVFVLNGKCPATPSCVRTLGKNDVLKNGARLACQARIQSDLIVEIPDSSLFETQQQIVTEDSGGVFDIEPAIEKKYLELPIPDQNDARSDMQRIRNALAPLSLENTEIDVLRRLPEQLRTASFKGTAVLARHELIGFEPGNTEHECYGAAFDLGTTTIAGTLINLSTGKTEAVEARVNPQTRLGDDVISRIRLCREHGRLKELQETVVDAVNCIVANLCDQAGVRKSAVYEIVLAGNTTMQQIACGIDPSALGELPFVPAFRDALDAKAADLGIDINRNGRIHVFPQIGGFVGGDTVAGVMAAHLDRQPGIALLIDVGTNGEIVLARNGRLVAASVAAGPAFEGAGISCGMRAAKGAVEKVVISEDVIVNVIGNVKPAGLCGSGLIDAAAEMLRVGVLDRSGRILTPQEAPRGIPKAVKDRLLERDEHVDFEIVSAPDPIVLTQKDMRELQLANAAIRAGIGILMRMEEVSAQQLDQVMLAGGFGSFIRRSNAQRIGLLPRVPHDRIRFVGNASFLGAKRALLSTADKKYAAEIAGKTRHVDLSLSQDFQDEFGSAMHFPEDE